MNANRTWMWLGGVVAVAGVALAAGVPLATLLTLALVLACPASMFLMMRMGMGGAHGGAQAGSASAASETQARARPGLPAGSRPVALLPGNDGAVPPPDPVTILKRRLAAGEITLEEYDRLTAVISAPAGTPRD